MKIFVTGGSGFIGRHLIRQLVARKHTVKALSRSPNSDILLRQIGAQPVRGHLHDLPALRSGMEKCDAVFHLAAWYGLGKRRSTQAERVNVGGTHNVLQTAYQAGIPRIIYTSTVAVFGDTRGRLVDETYRYQGPFLSEYDRTKWLAHYRVALPLLEKGAPITILMPGAVYGPGDSSIVNDLMRLFLQGRLPFIPGPETALAYAHVEDIAAGHLLALEKGRPGESYILAGPVRTLREMAHLWAALGGRTAPRLEIPATLLRPIAPLMGMLETLTDLSAPFTEEAIRSLGATYIARSDKARAELGWRPRPLEEGMRETVESALPYLAPPADADTRRKRSAAVLLVAALMTILWLMNRDE